MAAIRGRTPILALTAAVLIMAAAAYFLLSPPGTGAQSTEAPSPPTDVTAELSLGTIVLSWAPSQDTVTGYQIYRRLVSPGETFAMVDTAGASDTSWTETGTLSAGSYAYRVKSVNGDLVGVSSTPATIELSEPITWSTTPQPSPSSHDDVEMAEIARLHEVIEQHLGGCVIYPVDNPVGDGHTYAVNTDNAICVSQIELLMDPCTPTDRYASISEYHATITIVNGHLRQLVTQAKSLHLHTGYTVHSISDISPSDPFIETSVHANYIKSVDRLEMQFNNTGRSDYTPSTGIAQDYHDDPKYADLMRHMWERLNAIIQGQDYHTTVACLFHEAEDAQDNLKWSTNAEATIPQLTAGTTQSTLDYGPEKDLFSMEFTADQPYYLVVRAVDPTDVEAESIRLSDVSQNLRAELLAEIATVDPMLEIIDGDENVLASAQEGEVLDYLPATTGTYYARVSHATEEDWTNAGFYTIELGNSGDQGVGDAPADRSTTMEVEVGGSANGYIDHGDDNDWIRFTTEAGQMYRITVEGVDAGAHTAAESPVVTAVYNSTQLDQTGVINGHTNDDRHITHFRANSAGDHYIAIINESALTGSYRVSVETEDHINPGETEEYDLVTKAKYWYEGQDEDTHIVTGQIDFEGDVDTFRANRLTNAHDDYTITVESRSDGTTPSVTVTAVRTNGSSLRTSQTGNVFTVGPSDSHDAGRSIYENYEITISADAWDGNPVRYAIARTSPQHQLGVPRIADDDYQDPAAYGLNPKVYQFPRGETEMVFEGALNGNRPNGRDSFIPETDLMPVDMPAGSYTATFEMPDHRIALMQVGMNFRNTPDAGVFGKNWAEGPVTSDQFTLEEAGRTTFGISNRLLNTYTEYTLTITRTSEAPADEAPEAEAPAAPTSLTGQLNDDGTITLSWTAPEGDVTSYQILRRRPAQGEGSLTVYVDNTGSTATTYTDNSVSGEGDHVYRVKARNAAGLGPQSNFVKIDR